MQRASKLFNDAQRKQIDEAVAQAESGTSAEIVPVVASASGRYDRPEDIAGLWVGVIAMIFAYIFLPRPSGLVGHWDDPLPWLHLLYLILVLLAGLIFTAIIASDIGWLRRMFTPRNQMRDEVDGRAREVFFDNRIHHTAGGTGILIYVSLYERMAVILADRQVVEQITQPTLDEVCHGLAGKVGSGHATEAICEALDELGSKLATLLPRAQDDVNEVPDALVTID